MDIVREWWGLTIAAVGALLWLSRLEARGLQNEREIKRLWNQRKEDIEQAQKSRDEMHEMLREMRDDIKMLLQRDAKR